MRKFLNIFILLSSFAMFASQLPVAYEYWLDGNHLSSVRNAFFGEEMSLDVDVTQYPPGSHSLTYRFQDEQGRWGSTITKTFLVPFAAPTSANPKAYQYWLDGDFSNVKSALYTGDEMSLDVDVAQYAPGSHNLTYRFQDEQGRWGSTITRTFLVPFGVGTSTKPIAYRELINGEIVNIGRFATEQEEYNISLPIDENIDIENVTNREFSYSNGLITMNIDGTFSYAVQMMSEDKVWGAPLINSFAKTDSFIQSPLQMDCPGDLTFDKVSTNKFVAVQFNTYGQNVYIRTSDDCTMQIYQILADGKWNRIITYTPQQLTGTVMFDKSTGANDTYIAVLYDMPVSKTNPDENVTLRLMAKDNQLPTPEISFDESTNELSITCLDKSATIYYTTDGTEPSKESNVYDSPIIVEHNMTVKAFAAKDGIADSFVATKTIDSFKVPKPELIREADGFLFVNSLDGVSTYYTLDGSSPTDRSKSILFDGNPFNITSTCKVLAYSTREYFNDSDIVSINVDPGTYRKLALPEVKFTDGIISITHKEDGTIANYTIYTDDDLLDELEGQTHTSPMPVSLPASDFYNHTIKVYAEKAGWGSSDTVTLSHSEAPMVVVNNLSIIMTASGEIHYTLDGSSPSVDSPQYTQPLKITENCVLRAINIDGDLIPGATDAIDVTYLKCEIPSVEKYDGRYLTINIRQHESIKYTINGEDPIEHGVLLDGVNIDMAGINTLRAVAVRDNYDTSDEITFTPEYYSDESRLITTAPHQVESAFAWSDDLSSIERLCVFGTLNDGKIKDGGSIEDNADYLWIINNLPGLRHIDLRNVSDKMVPDNALASDKIISVVMPAYMTTAGKDIFGTGNNTLCAIEFPANNPAPVGILDGIVNPNLLAYFVEERFAEPLRGKVQNVIYGDNFKANTISLTHGSPFFAPKAFTATTITYNRDFMKITAVDPTGYGAGWETISVPFDVQSVRKGDDLLEPFALSNRQGKPFWLFEGDGTGWKRSTEIHADIPYLIAMPNNPWYDDEYNVAGNITFSAANAYVRESSDDPVSAGFGDGNQIHSNYKAVSAEYDVFSINDSEVFWNVTYRPGGIFVRGLRDVPPFECYVTTADNGAKYVKIFGDTDEVEQLAGSGLHVWTEYGVLCVYSDIPTKLPVYDTLGRLIRIVSIHSGETFRISDLTSGIYIINGKKIIL